jgi:ABC-type antimicrobial peptide transport system permease subunit
VPSGHRIEDSHQIVLGTATLAALHKRIGDSVTVQGPGLTLHLRIVGTASLPTIGTTLGLHASISTGAVLSTAAFPRGLLDAYGPFSGPNAIFVRFRSGVGAVAGTRTLDHVVGELTALSRSPKIVTESAGDSAGLVFEALGPQRPAEIVNYRSMGTTPGVLATGLAAGAVAALGLTLVASVRRRRRELALLKTIGFTRKQLLITVAWQATVVAVLSLVIGTPLGIAFGRLLWLLFAHQLSAVAAPVIPAVSVAVVAVGTLVIANLVAALPGRIAAGTPTALLLRAE